jgi:hypothetical protein
MAHTVKLDPEITRLVRTILSEAQGRGARELKAWRHPEREIRRLLARDYARSLRERFGPAEMNYLVGSATAIWPDFNRSPMGPPSMRLFAEVSAQLRLHLRSAPYRSSGGFALRGFYVNRTPPALGRPLIYINSAHHLLAMGTAFCHEVGHHLSAGMFRSSDGERQTLLYFGAEYSKHMNDAAELAADILVSLSGYPKAMARTIFQTRPRKRAMKIPVTEPGASAFTAVREHLRARYGFDFTLALPPTKKLHYLTGMIHYARLREALLEEYDL